MAMNDKITAIRAALTALGFKNTTVTVENTSNTHTRVYINGECFGIFDCVRRTFVD